MSRGRGAQPSGVQWGDMRAAALRAVAGAVTAGVCLMGTAGVAAAAGSGSRQWQPVSWSAGARALE